MVSSFYPITRNTSHYIFSAMKTINFGYVYHPNHLMVMFKNKSDKENFNKIMARRIQK